MRKRSRAQAALEFMMTYGWAILVIVIVLSILFYIGVLNPKGASGNSCLFAPGTSCYAFKLANGTGALILDLGQATGKTISITGIGCSQNFTIASQNITGLAQSVTVGPGEHTWVVGGSRSNAVNCTDSSGNNLTEANSLAGDRYKGTVCIKYTESGVTGASRVVCGDLTARFEPIATAELGPAPTPGPLSIGFSALTGSGGMEQGYTHIELSHPATATGTVTTCEVYVSGAGGAGTAKIKIFRPNVTTYIFVTEITTPVLVTGRNIFPCTLPVQAGDLIGYYSADRNPQCDPGAGNNLASYSGDVNYNRDKSYFTLRTWKMGTYGTSP